MDVSVFGIFCFVPSSDHDLEFRTVVQNMVNKEQHLKMSFRIIGADGITVKYGKFFFCTIFYRYSICADNTKTHFKMLFFIHHILYYDRDSEKYRIIESNVTKANDHDLEFRTVVQNMVNKEQHLKMSFRIIGACEIPDHDHWLL